MVTVGTISPRRGSLPVAFTGTSSVGASARSAIAVATRSPGAKGSHLAPHFFHLLLGFLGLAVGLELLDLAHPLLHFLAGFLEVGAIRAGARTSGTGSGAVATVAWALGPATGRAGPLGVAAAIRGVGGRTGLTIGFGARGGAIIAILGKTGGDEAETESGGENDREEFPGIHVFG